MTFEQMLSIIDGLGADATYFIANNEICVDLVNFKGFDKNHNKIKRDFDNPEAVEAFEQILENEYISWECDFYTRYYFDGFSVRFGYTSLDY